jgi:hypothetical protein
MKAPGSGLFNSPVSAQKSCGGARVKVNELPALMLGTAGVGADVGELRMHWSTAFSQLNSRIPVV